MTDSSEPIPTTPAAALVERLTREGLIGMHAAAKLYGQAHENKTAHASTPTRHAITGVRLHDGRRLKLETIRVGGRLMTSRAAVLRFFAAQNDTDTDTDPAPVAGASPTPKQRTRAASAASRKLDTILGSTTAGA